MTPIETIEMKEEAQETKMTKSDLYVLVGKLARGEQPIEGLQEGELQQVYQYLRVNFADPQKAVDRLVAKAVERRDNAISAIPVHLKELENRMSRTGCFENEVSGYGEVFINEILEKNALGYTIIKGTHYVAPTGFQSIRLAMPKKMRDKKLNEAKKELKAKLTGEAEQGFEKEVGGIGEIVLRNNALYSRLKEELNATTTSNNLINEALAKAVAKALAPKQADIIEEE
ncbi:hypothetical protein HVZ88_25465 (plasmid) [Escherichia coli]|nr:hypothetical protein HVZ88_25465 [Escherichia coli]